MLRNFLQTYNFKFSPLQWSKKNINKKKATKANVEMQ